MENSNRKSKLENRRIIFIGGHHNSALLVAKALKAKGFKIFWFGHKHTIAKEKSLSLEYLEVTKAGLPFYQIHTGKFYRNFQPWQWLKIFYGLGQCFCLLLKIKPRLVFSFGGYLSFPAVLAAKILRIKIIIHEQTSQAGLANRTLASLADQVLLTWPSSTLFFPRHKTKLVGLPLKKEFLISQKARPIFKEKLATIFITGGKQGSHLINQAVAGCLKDLLSKYNLIHQSGAILKTGDFEKLTEQKRSLPAKLQDRYLLQKFFYDKQMPQMFKAADLVVARAGAHTVYELASLEKPALLIPLPWAYNQEQLKNAQILQKSGLALILPQKQLSSQTLKRNIDKMLKNLNRFKGKHLPLISIERKATDKIVKVIIGLLENEAN